MSQFRGSLQWNQEAREKETASRVDRFALAISHVADKRLTYAEVTGKVGETGF
jgi:hypothetical protein